MEILRAVVSGSHLHPATVEVLVSIGWASVTSDGTVLLTVAGKEAHSMLEKLDAVPEEHVDLLEKLSGPATAEEAEQLAANPKSPRKSLLNAP